VSIASTFSAADLIEIVPQHGFFRVALSSQQECLKSFPCCVASGRTIFAKSAGGVNPHLMLLCLLIDEFHEHSQFASNATGNGLGWFASG